jgi:microcompartment protein CcmK/EutM
MLIHSHEKQLFVTALVQNAHPQSRKTAIRDSTGAEYSSSVTKKQLFVTALEQNAHPQSRKTAIRDSTGAECSSSVTKKSYS